MKKQEIEQLTFEVTNELNNENIIEVSKDKQFKLLSKTEKTYDYINKLLINYPKKETILKENIEQTLYEIIELIISYKVEDIDRVKLKYLKSLVIKLSMLDFYLRASYKKKCINIKKYRSCAGFLEEIRKITYGVIKYEKRKDK